MEVLRIDIERALDELASQEEGMRFQGLAVVLGKMRWPELIARQRKKDMGLDAYAHYTLTQEKVGKGLAASITPTIKKISDDAQTAIANFPDLKMLLFVTCAKVGNADRERWQKKVQSDLGLELHILEREEIITQMMMPGNASLCSRFLNIPIDVEQDDAVIINRAKRAAATVSRAWAGKMKGHPLIELSGVLIDRDGAETTDVLTVEQIDQVLSQSGRVVLEGPAGRGKTTTLIQLAQRARTSGTPFIVELPAWTTSRKGILEYIAGMPQFQAEGLTPADLARIQKTEPFLFLLNGWNEIAESNSTQAIEALREVERDFPSAGIIVATRTHHLTPPLPGAVRLRLMRLRRVQRVAYLTTRLGLKGAELIARINVDPSLDELTRTPFILSEVTSLFEAGYEIPSTKIDILTQVLHLQSQRDQHRNALQTAPIFGEQTEYLKALATEMSHRGAVALPEADARAVVSTIARGLLDRGQIERVGAPAILATLTAHDVLERVDYPQVAFQFEHQQLQEYYAALDVRMQLINLRSDDLAGVGSFMASYVNDPAWAEPLRMIAETFSKQTGNVEIDRNNTNAGRMLVEMALAVDVPYGAELAQLCGETVWNEVQSTVGESIRAIYSIHDGCFGNYAIAAMLATGVEDFSDIIIPLISGEDQQIRLSTYRLWPDIHLSSLGPNWGKQVSSWSELARTDFVSEMLHRHADTEIASFAAEDNSVLVKKAAASVLMWTGADEALIRVLDSMDADTFEEIARQHPNGMPLDIRHKTIASMRNFIETTTNHTARLQTTVDLINYGETYLDGIAKDAMAEMSVDDIHNYSSHYIKQALEYLHPIDPAWVSEWVVNQVAEGVLYEHEYWLSFATAIPEGLIEKYIERLETENLTNVYSGGMISIIVAHADANLAARMFAKLRELRREIDAQPGVQHELEWQITHQLESVFRSLPGDVTAMGILSSVASGDQLDIKVTTGLLSKVARSELEPLLIDDNSLKIRLRDYLKCGVEVVLLQDDFSGEEKANLASSIAQVGNPGDMEDLVKLISSDIERQRRGREARAAGDRGPIGNGGSMSYASWHIEAVILLDSTGAEQVLIDLLGKQEYLPYIASAMARDFLPKQTQSFGRVFNYDSMWVAREGHVTSSANERRRSRFAAALNAEIKHLHEQSQDGKPVAGLKALANALAAIDGRQSSETILDVIAIPGQWDQYTSLEAAERLLMTGVVLPTNAIFALVNSILERTENWMHDSDRHLLRRILAICPFVDDPAAGIAKVFDVLGKRRLHGYELQELVTALGESRSDAAFNLLYELASDVNVFEHFEDNFLNAFAALDTPRARNLMLAFVDPDICSGIVLTRPSHGEGVLVVQIAKLAQRRPEVAERLRNLCERDLSELNRHVLSKVMGWLGTHLDLTANLNLIDDAKSLPIPQGVWDQLESAFIERRPYGQTLNTFTQHARASNDVRIRLLQMTIGDEKRRKSALMLLGQIEVWRLEYGRPPGEPRHPDFASGQSWPPKIY